MVLKKSLIWEEKSVLSRWIVSDDDTQETCWDLLKELDIFLSCSLRMYSEGKVSLLLVDRFLALTTWYHGNQEVVKI